MGYNIPFFFVHSYILVISDSSIHLRIARQCLDKVLKQKDKLKKHSAPGDSRKEAQAALLILVSFFIIPLLLCMSINIELWFVLFCE